MSFACPELDYGDGWDYDKTLNYLKANPDVDIKEFARKVEFWNIHHGAAMDMTHKVHAAYDMSKYESFHSASRSFQFNSNYTAKQEEKRCLRFVLSHSLFRCTAIAGQISHSLYRLGDLKKFTIAPVNAELKKASFNLVQAIDEMILAKATGSLRTIIFPLFHSLSS